MDDDTALELAQLRTKLRVANKERGKLSTRLYLARLQLREAKARLQVAEHRSGESTRYGERILRLLRDLMHAVDPNLRDRDLGEDLAHCIAAAQRHRHAAALHPPAALPTGGDGAHTVYCYLADDAVADTGNVLALHVHRNTDGDAIGVEILNVQSVTIDGQPADARPPDVDVCVPPCIWTTVPGTHVQVHHEAEGAAWYRPCLDGSLILREPGVGWSTRLAPEEGG